MRKVDVIVIAVLTLLALCWFGWWMLRGSGYPLVYAVLVDGVEVAVGSLYEQADGAPHTFNVPGRSNVIIRVENGKAAFMASDCPDQICVNTGFISLSGQSAACVPNGVILLIRGDTADGVDAVASLP